MTPLRRILFAVMTMVVLASCEHNVSMLTDVHADGSLDKTVILETNDTSRNMLGIDAAHGWEAKQVSLKNPDGAEEAKSDSWKYKVTLKKHFPSASAANAELAVPSDTLFRITSTFEERFRWFYTYVYYADTYHAVNRLTYPIEDYLTREDYAFIDRLPAEGKPISRADSLYLAGLHDKIYDQYGGHAYLETYYLTARELLMKSGVASAWLDTLSKHKEHLYTRVRDNRDIDEDFMVAFMDSLGIPLPTDADRRFAILIKPFERIISFISTAGDGKYQHAIHMPQDVIRTNADSVAGSSAFWSPPVIRFMVKDYTMYAEVREMNYWAVAISLALIGFTFYLLWRRIR